MQIYIVEVGREPCLPAQSYNQFQFEIHQTTIFKGYSDQITGTSGTACLNFFTVVRVERRKTPYIANLYCPYSMHVLRSACMHICGRGSLIQKKQTPTIVEHTPHHTCAYYSRNYNMGLLFPNYAGMLCSPLTVGKH